MWTMKQIMIGTRMALPYAVRLTIAALIGAFWLMVLSIISMFKGLSAVEQIALHWQAEALANGFPDVWERHLLNAFRVLAFCTILLGWLMILFTGYFMVDYGYELIFVQP